jgi:DNA polymerase III subunit delta'
MAEKGATTVSHLVERATEHQPRARGALAAALATGPCHAYLFQGPRGAGKRAAARAFAAEILAVGAGDPDEARRRALLDPSPHPDLVWLAPTGAQHLVEEVRERVIRAAAYRPYEGGKRVFVVEAAEAMRDESQNALLKTLEEPPDFVHLILLSSEPASLLETVGSRCQVVAFAPLSVEAVEAALAADGIGRSSSADEIAAAARLSGGDVELARLLLDERGRKLRADAVATDFEALLADANAAGEEAEAATREALDAEKEAGLKRSARDVADESKRAGRRRRTELLDLGLALTAAWYRDLAALAVGAADVVHNRDRLDELTERAAGLDAGRARRAAELVQDTRRRLDLNVSEELALEALFFRLGRALA